MSVQDSDSLFQCAGYNHPALKRALSKGSAMMSMVNRPSLSRFPPMDFTDKLKDSLMSVVPPGLNRVSTMMCGSCSNENAFKAAFITYMVSVHTCLADLSMCLH